MRPTYPCGGLGRRAFLKTGLAGAAALPWIGSAPTRAAQGPAEGGPLGLPGPYPGRVVESRHPRMIHGGAIDRAAVKLALDRGLTALTDADDAVGAWRRFFEPGDVVGIKMNPVGKPFANSTSELMLEVIAGLEAAGVKRKDIVVFERYRDEFVDAKMHEAVPEGIAWTGLSAAYSDEQTDLRGDDNATGNLDHVAGYDPDQFVTMELAHSAHDPRDERTRRSHLGLLVTRRVNKLVLLPVLKDHGSAGVTGALKNMSHGLVNNVARSHSDRATNVCNQFIPAVVSHPILRQKCVLQILDGIKGVYQGGPFGGNPNWIWENNALYLATDPVAMDHLAWRIVDAKRKEKGLPPVGAVGKLALDPEREGFDIRQPQHIALAGHLGLGVFDWHKIDHRIVNAV